MIAKFINLIKSHQYSIFLVICIGLISFTSYNLGRINVPKSPIKITGSANLHDVIKKSEDSIEEANSPQITPKSLDTRVVASKNSDKYHYTWCSGAKKIKEENKIWFNSDEEAEAKGYTLAGNCIK